MRFGLLSIPEGRQAVRDDGALARTAGFDVLATADHIRHPRDPDSPVLDGWSVLAAWAATVEKLRLAVLVSNIIYRQPTVLAKQVVTIDQLSDGRVDIGIGAGVYPTDHAMSGTPMWSPSERVSRLKEFVGAIDAALTGQPSFNGIYYRFADAAVAPGTIQRPRPPIVLGAVGPSMLRLTAEVADVWSAFGGMAIEDEETFFSVLAKQNEVLNHRCDEIGRDPRTLRRSLLAFRPLTPWRSRECFERLAEHAHRLGFEELILYMPSGLDEHKVFDEVATDVLPELRAV
jgi:alkanesulfonate monooxygenase SsuD/methylene tetrahydromethanopterin reductase-like flavin-dependent oxidoreductase (luciferase family)